MVNIHVVSVGILREFHHFTHTYMHLNSKKKVDDRGNRLNLTISDLRSKVKVINWKKVIT